MGPGGEDLPRLQDRRIGAWNAGGLAPGRGRNLRLNARGLIRKTRDGIALSREEIRHLVEGAVSGDIPEYQVTAWMMAVFFRGLGSGETAELTLAMLESGERLAFDMPGPLPADKHSTGGVGDKISFLAAPIVAAAGVPVPMISGRSLGHTGGTLDKLESIPGFRPDLSPEEFRRTVRTCGLSIASQSARLAPADRLFYQLRDAAAIVESIPLITASILSKKAAAGVRALALDVKVGDGAFMPDLDRARQLSRSLVETAGKLGIRARALLTRMDYLLGRTAGNAIEIAESVRFLRREEVAEDLRELTMDLGAAMVELSGAADDRAPALAMLHEAWTSGRAYERFVEMVGAQGGDVSVLEHAERLPRAPEYSDVAAPRSGTFIGVRARAAGEWIAEAGGGRLRAGDAVDPRIGVELLIPGGAAVRAGDPVMRLHASSAGLGTGAAERAAEWLDILEEPQLRRSMILDTLDA